MAPLTLEDQVFGRPLPGETEPPLRDRMRDLAGDPVAHYMLPFLAALILMAVVVWSIVKSIQYTELFHVHPRYQYGLCGLNVAAILVAMAVVCYHYHQPPKA